MQPRKRLHCVWHNGKKYYWNDRIGDFVYCFRNRSGDPVVKKWRKELAKLNKNGAAIDIGANLVAQKREAAKRRRLEVVKLLRMRLAATSPSQNSVWNHEDFASGDESRFEPQRKVVPKRRAKIKGRAEAIKVAESLGIDARDAFMTVPDGVAELWAEQLLLAARLFGTNGWLGDNGRLKNIKIKEGGFGTHDYSSYKDSQRTIYIREDMNLFDYGMVHGRIPKEVLDLTGRIKVFSTRRVEHIPRHEIGHAIFYAVMSCHGALKATQVGNDLREYYEYHFHLHTDGLKSLSWRAGYSLNEMVAESIACVLGGEDNKMAYQVVRILIGEKYD